MLVITMKFLFQIFVVANVILLTLTNKDVKREAVVDNYEKLIENGTQEALQFQLPVNAKEYRSNESNTFEEYGTYDFVIVGAGTAGSVVAARLAEIEGWKVLLIEAGGPETNFSEILNYNSQAQCSRLNWNFKTVKQTHASQGIEEETITVPRGKGLGGTTTINTALHYRFNRLDYEEWRRLGNPGWSYQDVLPYFIKTENYEPNDGDLGFHGKQGYWNIRHYVSGDTQQFSAVLEGFKQLYGNSSTSEDYNGKNQLGMFRIQYVHTKQIRLSSFRAVTLSALSKKNLEVLQHSYVTRILIDPNNKVARGVEFTKNGKSYRVNAQKEVILSAGSIKSPHILMMSGIGPKDQLTKIGIPQIHNLPVGRHLSDHPKLLGLYIVTNVSENTEPLRQQIEEFLDDRGKLTISDTTQGVAFLKDRVSGNTKPDYPDYELVFATGSSPGPVTKKLYALKDDVYNAIISAIYPHRSIKVGVFLFNVKSQGTIQSISDDPFEYPLVNLTYLSHPEETDMIYRAVKEVEKLTNTPAMRRIGAEIARPDYPACRDFSKGSEEYWKCAIRLLGYQGYHFTGSCRMGPRGKNVVDHRGRVHGIGRLRVIDASVIPILPAGHTASPTLMIGEKLSDRIKKDYGVKS